MCEERHKTAWRRSSWCANSNCVEVAKVSADRSVREVRVRDSKDPRSRELAFDAAAWQSFIEGVKNGDLDRR